ncbi:MAG: hypothetical protein ACKVS6_08115 [Planctomycetota bacterium]
MIRLLQIGLCLWVCSAVFVKSGHSQDTATKPKSESSAKERWNQLSEPEREKFRQIYNNFKTLSKDEQLKLRDRAQAVKRECDLIEKRVSADDHAVISVLGTDAKDQVLRQAVMEVFRARYRGMEHILSKDKIQAALQLEPAARDAALRRLAEEMLGEIVKKTLRSAEKRKTITTEESARISAMDPHLAWAEVLDIRKKSTLADIERHPERFGEITDTEMSELRTMPTEKFFSRIEALRAVPRVFGDKLPCPPGPNDKFGRSHGPHFNEELRAKLEAEIRAKAKAALLAKGVSPEEAEKQIKETPPWMLMKNLGGRGKRESSPSSRRGKPEHEKRDHEKK